MDLSYKSFRSIEPSEGHPVQAVRWNSTGSHFILAAGGSQTRLYSRDARMEAEYVKGDMYLLDMANTKSDPSSTLSQHQRDGKDRKD